MTLRTRFVSIPEIVYLMYIHVIIYTKYIYYIYMISKISNKAAVVARVWMLFFHKNKLYGSRNILVYYLLKNFPFRYKTLCLNKKSHKRAAITIVVFVSGLFIFAFIRLRFISFCNIGSSTK